MAEVVKDHISNNLLLGREYPRPPSSISPASSRRDSLRPAHPESGSEPSTVVSSPSSLRQKRVASLSIDAANEPRLEGLALTSPSNISAISVGEKVCLCQPDPKIPRPRNAFILYRQHYQAQVVALHPGLANPEISKIIGEQWTSQPPEVKNEWKRLAEEEKIRHQRQYPDYRYQPRRAGTAAHTRRISSGDDPIRCPKCSGRYILTPRTPSTPSTPGLRAQYERLHPPFVSQGTPPRNMNIGDRARFPAVPNNTPRTIPSHSQIRWRPGSLQQNHATVEMNSPRERRLSVDMSGSPDFKRCRFNNGTQGHTSLPHYDSPQYRSGRPPTSATGFPDGRRTQLPPGPLLQHQKGGMMEPPPRPSPAMHQFSNMSLNSPHDESLRLPPLQTQGSLFGPGPSRMNSHHRADSQARGVEAMVMTIPYINKIKVLSKISPPLAPPGPTSPVQNVRGAVIAVEGADYKLVAEVGRFIHDYLSKEPECLVKTWPASDEKIYNGSVDEAEMAGVGPPISGSSTPNSPYLAYLSTIQSWHSRSIEIGNFITAMPSSLPTASVLTSTSAPSPIISLTTTVPTPPLNLPPPPPSTIPNPTPSTAPPPTSSATAAAIPSSSTTSTAPPPPPTTTQTQTKTLPIALLPNGFSLSLSDTFASHIPITDAYAPVDHWQWMATLWRGIVGPDLTVYIKSLDVVSSVSSVGNSNSSSVNGINGDREAAATAAAVDDEMARFGGVECRWDVGAVIVRVPGNAVNAERRAPGGTAGGDEAGRVDEKTLRRLGFEVLEWVRGGMGGVGGGAGGRVGFGARG